MNTLMITTTLIAVTLGSGLLQADPLRHAPREFTKTVTGETSKGTTTRQIERHRIDNGIVRNQTLTTPDGRTASRSTTTIIDRDNQTRTRDITGTRLNGDTYTGHSVTTRTDNGYVTAGTRTNADGKTATRVANVDMNRATGVMTQQVTYTNFEGETHRKTVVVERPSGVGGNTSE